MRAGRRNKGILRHGSEDGSALILTVVLTSLLAIVGVLFVMVTRIDRMATSATSENQELALAVNTVVAEISELLAQDVPGMPTTPEYHDFPGVEDPWLADLEPYYDGGYRWRQISSIAGPATMETRNVPIRVIGERDPIADINDANAVGTNADADGDGVGDARWFAIPGVMSGKGRPIYGAVRIIDNGGMLNVNTGYWFDPNRADMSFSNPSLMEPSEVDGSSPLQINAIALAGGHVASDPNNVNQNHAAALLAARQIDPRDGLSGYENAVVWRYLQPYRGTPYTPFDLSDELELRYRGLVNHSGVDTRVENWGRLRAGTIWTPVDSAGLELDLWFARARDAGALDPNYARRHVATTYNMDRIITPSPVELGSRKKVNVNNTSRDEVYQGILAALSETGGDPVQLADNAAQVTANLLDYIDDDDEVTVIDGASASGSRYYGFERPCIYISEIAHNAITIDGEVYHSYAIELHKPYFEDHDPCDGQWRLTIETAGTDPIEQPIVWSGLRRFHVLLSEDPVVELFDNSDFADPEEPTDTLEQFRYDRNRYASPTAQELDSQGFGEGSRFRLQRWVSETQEWLTVDNVTVAADGWMAPDQGPHSVQRDISRYKCIRRLWTPTGVTPVVLGHGTGQFADPNDEGLIQAHPANRTLRNIGELGMLFAGNAYGVMPGDAAEDVLLDLANPNVGRLFNYLTVIDPKNHGHTPDETRIMGRININTAPWFVLAQLPWIQYQDDSSARSTRARAIVAYREANGPFRNIGGLMQVSALHDLADPNDGDNLNDEDPRGPDLTRDSARNDLEERDLLFTRMSNLVTVRSDVFTAYIQVRIGVDGPQKRMIAILDRSETTPTDPAVRVVALHPVADPR